MFVVALIFGIVAITGGKVFYKKFQAKEPFFVDIYEEQLALITFGCILASLSFFAAAFGFM
jgi:hypothetical protein